MIVVLANRWDEAAQALVGRWSSAGAMLLTPRDLSEPGWVYRPGRPGEGTAVVGGHPVDTGAISGVLTLLWAVSEHDLHRIAASERSFVAAEMTAFLVAWLTELTCPVINRPTASCLMGPSWSPEQWQLAATRAGCRVADPGAEDASLTTLTVIGESFVGHGHSPLREAARGLAREAVVDCLAVTFSGTGRDAKFVSASLAPNVLDPAVADALLEHLQRQVVAA